MLSQMTESQIEQYRVWRLSQDEKVARMQGNHYPYYGASGGGYSFIYTPTSLMMCVSVRNNITNEHIDLTDYENV